MSGAPPTLQLKPGKERSLLRRHPWVYASAVARVSGAAGSGQTVRVVSADGRFLAWAAFSPTSAIRARAWAFREDEVVDAALLGARVRAAVARRAALAPVTDAVRLVFGEGDALPGMVADRYGNLLVVQLLAAGVEAWREVLVDALVQATGCAAVYEEFLWQLQQRNLFASVQVTATGCMGPCSEGPSVLVYPEGVMYGKVG
jgi:23S rRNA (cytosine1962-C5)-methyltransferase